MSNKNKKGEQKVELVHQVELSAEELAALTGKAEPEEQFDLLTIDGEGCLVKRDKCDGDPIPVDTVKANDIVVIPIPKQFVTPIGYFDDPRVPADKLKNMLSAKNVIYDPETLHYYAYFAVNQEDDIELAWEVADGCSYSELLFPSEVQ